MSDRLMLKDVPLMLPVASSASCRSTHYCCACVAQRLQRGEAIVNALMEIRQARQTWQELYRSQEQTAEAMATMRRMELLINEHQALIDRSLDALNANQNQ